MRTHKPHRETVAQQKLVGAWDEYTQRRDSRQRLANSRRYRLARSKERAEALSAELTVQLNLAGKKIQFNDVEVVPVGGSNYGNHYTPPYKYAVRVSNRVLDWLLDEKRDH